MLSFVAANVTVADIEPIKAAATTDSAPLTHPAYPFIWVAYVALAIVIMGLFGASFARYHVTHRSARLARIQTARQYGARAPGSSRTSVSGTMDQSSPTRLPMYAKTVDVKQVLAAIYREDRKQLVSTAGQTRTRKIGRAGCSRTGSGTDIRGVWMEWSDEHTSIIGGCAAN